jgi:predicted DNA-binding protein (UPF0251 family)
MDKLLEQLAERLQVYDSEILTADEVADWPDGKLDELVSQSFLTEVEHSKGIVCDQCEENCYIEPDIRTNPDTGKTIGVFVCTRNSDIGRIEVDLNRLRRWRINEEKLKELGFLKKQVKRRKRKVSSELTKRESEAYRLVYIEGKTPQQAKIEMRCSLQNIYKLLNKAEVKVDALQSRSVNLAKAQSLPKDRRGQENISEDDTL